MKRRHFLTGAAALAAGPAFARPVMRLHDEPRPMLSPPFVDGEGRNLKLDDFRAMAVFAVVGLPTTILIDRQGREPGRLVGPSEWDSAGNVAQFETIIARGRN